jgi:hypothetical protein
MKFILFLMLFVTPATNPSKDELKQGYKDESKHIWTLQSTSTMEFASRDACRAVGASMVDNVAKVATVTVRGWCICESTDPNKTCPESTDTSAKNALLRYGFSPEKGRGSSVGIETLEPYSPK